MVMKSILTDGCTISPGTNWESQSSATQQQPGVPNTTITNAATALLQE